MDEILIRDRTLDDVITIDGVGCVGARIDIEGSGKIDWVVINNNSSSSSSSNSNLIKHAPVVMAKRRMMLPMICDQVRNKSFEDALKLAISKTKEKINKDCCNVLDVGSGTGLLSMLACRYGATSVTALEMNPDVAAISEEIIKDNDCDNKIKVQSIHSESYIVENEDSKPDIVVAELLDSLLIAEGIIPTFRDLQRRKVCKHDCFFIPSSGSIKAVIIEANELVDFLYTSGVYWGDDGGLKTASSIDAVDEDDYFDSMGSTPRYFRLHADNVTLRKGINVLSEVFEVSKFNFSSLTSDSDNGDDSLNRSYLDCKTKIVKDGKAQFLLLFWDINLLKGENITYSTSPSVLLSESKTGYFQDHWQNILIPIPPLSPDQSSSSTIDASVRAVSVGEEISFEITQTDTDLLVTSSKRSQSENSSTATSASKRMPPQHEIFFSHGILSDYQLAQLSSKRHIPFFSGNVDKALKSLLEIKDNKNLTILDVGNGIVGTASALYSLRNMNVKSTQDGIQVRCISLETDTISASYWSNVLANCPNGYGEISEVMDLSCTDFVEMYTNSLKIDLLVSDYYYSYAEHHMIDSAMVFFYQKKRLEKMLSAHAICIPSQSSIQCAGVRFRTPYPTCNDADNVCGFSHKKIVDIWRNKGRVFGMRPFEYDVEFVTKPIDLATIDYQAGNIRINKSEESSKNIRTLDVSEGSVIDACAFWVAPSSNAQDYIPQLSRISRFPIEIQFLEWDHQKTQKQIVIETTLARSFEFNVEVVVNE